MRSSGRRRDHHFKSWRPIDGLWAIDTRSAAGHCGRRQREDSGHHRQWVPARERRVQGTCARCHRGRTWTRRALGTRRLRRGRRAAVARSGAGGVRASGGVCWSAESESDQQVDDQGELRLMGPVEHRIAHRPSRRKALAQFAAFVASSPLLAAQQDPHGDLRIHRRVPGLDELDTVFDFEPLFHANLPLQTTEYTYHGDGSEFNLRRNRQAFDWVDIVLGTAVDPKQIDMSTELLGVKLTHPIYVAPSSGQGALHPDGEMGMYRGATAANTIMAIASGPSIPHARIAAAATGVRWNQFYPIADIQGSKDALAQYQDLGTKAIIITVDQQASVYERDLHDRNLGGVARRPGVSGRGRGAALAGDDSEAGPARGRGAVGSPGARTGAPGGAAFPANNKYRVQNRRLWYNWDYVNEIRQVIKVPVVIKGIVTPEDAVECARQGVDAIIISNHGGRSMDYGPSTLEVLPDIVAAVNGKIPVIIDSGFRRGSDVFKALALGATAVELGRAARWGLGAFGAAGAQRLLEVVQAEFVQAAAFAGAPNLKAINKSMIKANFV